MKHAPGSQTPVWKRASPKLGVEDTVATVYLRGLEPGKPLQLRYRLRATMPVKVAVDAARVYEYYDTAKQGVSSLSRLTVTQTQLSD